MDLERFCIKFPARSQDSLDEAIFIDVFQEWIRLHTLKGTLIDVVDYRHVPTGPGIMLISHEVNYAMDHGGGQFGLYAQRKLGEGSTTKDRILELVRSTATFGTLLESDSRTTGQISLDGGQFVWMANDRIKAPNTDEGFASIQPILADAAAELYPGRSVTVNRVQTDPRERLTAIVETGEAIAITALAPSS